MDINVVSELVGNVAFPIVAFMLMWKLNSDQRTDHVKEVNELSKVIDNNTTVVARMHEALTVFLGKNSE